MTYVPRTPPPLPKGPVVHRPVERRPSPFEAIRAETNPDGNYTFGTDRRRIAAQRAARKVLDELDARRRGEQRDQGNAQRRRVRAEGGTSGQRRNRTRPSAELVSDERLLELLTVEKLSCLQISRLTGVSQRTIRTRAHELGVHHPPVTRLQPQHTHITPEEMQQLRDRGLGWRAIADHFGVSYATIRRYRDRAGLDPNQKGTTAA
jgi:transposase